MKQWSVPYFFVFRQKKFVCSKLGTLAVASIPKFMIFSLLLDSPCCCHPWCCFVSAVALVPAVAGVATIAGVPAVPGVSAVPAISARTYTVYAYNLFPHEPSTLKKGFWKINLSKP
jgi:hypothetical protein